MTRKTATKAQPAPKPTRQANRPLTAADREAAFRTATRDFDHFHAAGIRAGMTDAELETALAGSLGIFGGSVGPGSLHVSHQGAGLRIWASWHTHNTVQERPLLAGPATIAMAREVYGIANPQNRQMRLF